MMPTEYEFKYSLHLDLLKEYPESALRMSCDKHLIIEQGYLAFSKGMSCRVRCTRENGQAKWYLTFKQKVTDRVVEIEKKLDERDGMDLWNVAVGKLAKDRYVFDEKWIKWELDLLKHDGSIYFILAEVELNEGTPRPKTMPNFMQKHCLYEVPLSDDRFSNKRLGDVNYARDLYNKLLLKQVDT
jgi:CYTH domain-containing protein